MVSKVEFKKCMQVFLVYFGKDCMSRDKMRLYYAFLKNYPAEDLKRAFMRILADRVYKNVPQIAEILMYLNGTTEKDLEIGLNLARETLKRSVMKYGSYKSVQFEDKGIHAVIDSLGGWTKMCAMDMNDFEKYLTFEFPKVYKAYKQMPYRVSEHFVGYDGDYDVSYIGYDEITFRSNLRIEENKSKLDLGELKNKMLIGV